MRLDGGAARSLARLLAWDAPVLPQLEGATAVDGAVEASWSAAGVPLRDAVAWPRARRLNVAVQVLAAADFLFERGWFAGRSLLWNARVVRQDGGDLVRLARPPRVRLDDPLLERRLRTRPGLAAEALAVAVAPLLRALVPERRAALAQVMRHSSATALAEGLLAVLTGDGKAASALQHPLGPGRALWSRQLAIPAAGVFLAEDDSTLVAATASARLEAAAGAGARVVAAGALEEDEIARIQARAAADGHDALVLTSLPVGGAAPLELAGGGAGVWVLAADPAHSLEHAARALDLAGGRILLVGEALARGAATAFCGPPARELGGRRIIELASPAARRALAWLACSAIGLDDDELTAVYGAALTPALAELERLRLVSRRDGRWYALSEGGGDAARLAALCEALPQRSWARCAALGYSGGEWRPLEQLCEEALAAGAHGTVLQLGRALPATAALALAGAEAALASGLLSEGERLLASVPESSRGARYHTLAGWWAEMAGLPVRAAEEIAKVGAAGGDTLPDRLAAWSGVVAAEAARRSGEPETAVRLLRDAVARSRGGVREAALQLALAEGPAAFRELRRRDARAWTPDTRARALHLLGYEAMSRGALAAAATAMRAALRCASGADPLLLGYIHADLARVAVMGEQPASAERYLRLAERLLERAGSRRAVTVVRANRGVLACDRFEWRQARELILASRELRGGVADSAWLFEELELARCDLACGDVEGVRAAMPRLRAALDKHPDHAVLREAFAALSGQLELALGNLAAAAAEAARADAGERELIEAVVRAAGGVEPSRSLPLRWGVAMTAQALARWRRGDRDSARSTIEMGLTRVPREAAVAFVRLAAIVVKGGEALPESWAELRRSCEAALADSRLEGWRGLLHRLLGVDAALLLRAVAGLVGAGGDSLAATHLEALGRALGVGAIEIRSGGVPVARWGRDGARAGEVEAGPVLVAFDRPLDGVLRAAGELLGHLVSGGAGASPAAGTAAGAGGGILGASAAATALREEVARWAPLPVTVLVLGEPGTGKELVARELHRASGRKGAFVAVNCAGIPGTLLEAELFGVARGAFTGADRDRPGLVEAAEHGTLFLDEVGELPGELQAKLLRLLQEREVRRVGATAVRAVDVRFVAATNRDLKAAAAAGAFRQDLYYRLSVAVVEIPPLRERVADIDELARHLLAHYAHAFGRPGVRLAPAALAVLRAGRWPGNVRELDSAIARAVAAARPGEVIGADHFAGLEPAAPRPEALQSWVDAVESFRRAYFAALLRSTGGNRSEAARRAGLSRQALLYHLRHLGKLET